jgi:activator-of-BECN1-regulated-autophagy protein 1
MENLANILIQREILSGRNYRRAIDAVLEKSFFQAKEKHCANDFPLSESVLSTIAIALSPDGETVATSHGDHTIKVFNFHDGKPRRIFNGHPRTPWTVKYHPTDSNIIASGCLGYEVGSII